MAKNVTVYGIKNCDTMKKARAWLDQHGVAYDFHDYKSAGIGRGTLEGWARALGWETLLNRSGRTFRGSGRVGSSSASSPSNSRRRSGRAADWCDSVNC